MNLHSHRKLRHVFSGKPKVEGTVVPLTTSSFRVVYDIFCVPRGGYGDHRWCVCTWVVRKGPRKEGGGDVSFFVEIQILREYSIPLQKKIIIDLLFIFPVIGFTTVIITI